MNGIIDVDTTRSPTTCRSTLTAMDVVTPVRLCPTVVAVVSVVISLMPRPR